MEKITNLKQINLYDKVSSLHVLWGKPIEDLFPIPFERYCKIFHPFRLSPGGSIPNEDTTTLLNGQNYQNWQALQDYEYRPVKLLAQIYNEPFDKYFNTTKVARHWGNNQPDWFLCPDSGTFDENSCMRIIQILTPFTEDSICYFHYDSYAIDTFEETIYKGKLSELKDTLHLGLKGSPSNIWPEKNNWFISTPFDGDFSIIAGDKTVIDILLTDNEIDAHEFVKDEILIPTSV